LYVGQLCSPSQNLKAIEAQAVSKILGFATNSLCFDCVFSMHMLGGLKFPRPTIALCAAKFRASLKTLKGCEDYVQRLNEMALDHLPLASAYSNCEVPGWDSKPFCFIVSSARKGYFDLSACPQELCKLFAEAIADDFRRAGPSDKLSHRVQWKCYEALYNLRFDTNSHWCTLLLRRFHDFGIDCAIGEVSHFIAQYCEVLSSLPQSKRSGVAMICIKTFVNSWCTSDRMGERTRLPCIFGCKDCKDRLTHYLRCNPLWLVACSALRLDDSYASIDFPRRLGFPVPSSTSLILLCVMFKTYHALRRDFASMITLSVADEDFSDLMHRAFFLANHFAADWI
jgi:hypothetical protein